jgi:hypothetical protein
MPTGGIFKDVAWDHNATDIAFPEAEFTQDTVLVKRHDGILRAQG